MTPKRKLKDPKLVKAKIDGYLLDNKTPTLSGLMLALGVRTLNTLYRYMDEDKAIGKLISEAYLKIVDYHEKRLFDKGCVGSIFYLKSVRRFGFNFREYDNADQVKDNVLNIRIIEDKDVNQSK